LTKYEHQNNFRIYNYFKLKVILIHNGIIGPNTRPGEQERWEAGREQSGRHQSIEENSDYCRCKCTNQTNSTTISH